MAKQTVQVGFPYRRTIVTVLVHETTLQIPNDNGDEIVVVPRTTSEEVTRFKQIWERTQHPESVNHVVKPLCQRAFWL